MMNFSKNCVTLTNKLHADYADSTVSRWTMPLLKKLHGIPSQLESFEQLANKRNPSDTAEKHQVKCKAAADKLRKKIEKTQEALIWQYGELQDELHARITEKSKLNPTRDAAEIRVVLRGMSQTDRNKAIEQALDVGDYSVLSAVAEGSPLTTGIDPQYRERLLADHQANVAPVEMQAMAALDQLAADAEAVFSTAEQACKASHNKDFVEKILQAEQWSKSAEKDFESATA